MALRRSNYPKTLPGRPPWSSVGSKSLNPPGRVQRASERSERSERSDHDLYRALRFLSIFSCVSIASVSCTFLDIFRVLLFVILVRASRSDAKTGLCWALPARRFPVFSRFGGFQDSIEAKARQDAPKTPPRRPKTSPRRPQDDPKTPPGRPKTPPGAEN